MDSSVLLTTVAAAIGFFTLFRNFRSHQNNKDVDTSSSSSSSPSYSSSDTSSPSHSSSSSVVASPLSHSCTHQVFPSFHGADVRRSFLSHILKEFRRKGIEPFIDNNIERSKSIGPKLIKAIRGSRISIVLLSRNYASSSWCLNELVEIMKCREELGQIVMTIFYEVDPTDIKKQTGDFGKVFRKTCKGKTNDDIRRWKQALAQVSKIAGYHSRNWDSEAAMIEIITNDISNKLNHSTPSNDCDGLIGMSAHMEKMEPLFCLESNEVRMIGIWGPSGIGKTTIARFIFKQLSENFHLSVFMENVKAFMCTRPVCSDDYYTKLHLHQQLMSRILNQKDIEIPHLGVAQERLKDKRVLVVLDDVDKSVQLDAMAKDTRWFGPGSRIIITTQDKRLLRAHGIKDIYKVDFPTSDEALEIFCMNAFGQSSPKDGFEELAWEVTQLAGELPLGLKVMGSYLRKMSKEEWRSELPRLRNRLDGEIESILKFSYDSLNDEEKDIFLHIACLFNFKKIEEVEEILVKRFFDVRSQLRILGDKSLIIVDGGFIFMHDLLAKLGNEIVCKQSIYESGERQFLVDAREICQVLTDTSGSRSVIGINLNLYDIDDQLIISERAFEGMYNLQFLRFRNGGRLLFPQGLNYLSHKLRLLHWSCFPMTCLPSKFQTDFLVKLFMKQSKLEKLWEGIRPLRNLKWMDLSNSTNLKELPDLSTATNLKELNLEGCSNLMELPSSIGNATNLKELNLRGCSSLVELPSSIGNLHKLNILYLNGCSKLESLPTNINLETFEQLDLTDCSRLKSFPEISTNIKRLMLSGTAIEEVPSSIMSWSHLSELHMPYNANLKELPHALEHITVLDFSHAEIQEIPTWIIRFSRLHELILKGCKKLVSLPQLPDSVSKLDAEDCESLERLECSFHFHPEIHLNFVNCYSLNKEARDLIIKTSSTNGHVVLPGREVPAYFTNRAVGRFLTVKLNERTVHTSLRVKICILLVNKVDDETGNWKMMVLTTRIMDKQNGLAVTCEPICHDIKPALAEHLYSFEFEAEMTSSELLFEFKDRWNTNWEIGECGVLFPTHDEIYQRSDREEL